MGANSRVSCNLEVLFKDSAAERSTLVGLEIMSRSNINMLPHLWCSVVDLKNVKLRPQAMVNESFRSHCLASAGQRGMT